MAEGRSESGVKSVQVALDVIEAVAATEGEIGVSELALKLGLTKATVFRHLQTLVERNYLVQNQKTARYRLGIQCRLLGQASASRTDLLTAAEEASVVLRDQTGLSVVVSTVRMRDVVVLTTQLASAATPIAQRPGTEMCLYGSAQGRVAVAFSRKPLLAQIKRQKRVKYTSRTTTEWPELEAKIAKVRDQGWADAPEELALGLNAVAAPIFDDSADCVGAIAVVGLINDLPDTPDQAVIDALLAAAERISVKLGFNPAIALRRHTAGQG